MRPTALRASGSAPTAGISATNKTSGWMRTATTNGNLKNIPKEWNLTRKIALRPTISSKVRSIRGPLRPRMAPFRVAPGVQIQRQRLRVDLIENDPGHSCQAVASAAGVLTDRPNIVED